MPKITVTVVRTVTEKAVLTLDAEEGDFAEIMDAAGRRTVSGGTYADAWAVQAAMLSREPWLPATLNGATSYAVQDISEVPS